MDWRGRERMLVQGHHLLVVLKDKQGLEMQRQIKGEKHKQLQKGRRMTFIPVWQKQANEQQTRKKAGVGIES